MSLLTNVSKVKSLPLLNVVSPAVDYVPEKEVMANYYRCQSLALEAAKAVEKLLHPDWTEKKAAATMEVYLKDSGVRSFFHKPFAWFGDRTRFVGVKNYRGFLPTNRKLGENAAYILDVAPILNGYVADIGHSGFYGESEAFNKAADFLQSFQKKIPDLFNANKPIGNEIWQTIDRDIVESGYSNIHKLYPLGVLGHRVHKINEAMPRLGVLRFGWQSYWSLLSRGGFGQIINQNFVGDLKGLWAIEPHIGGEGFGLKFEEILVFDGKKARWLKEDYQAGL